MLSRRFFTLALFISFCVGSNRAFATYPTGSFLLGSVGYTVTFLATDGKVYQGDFGGSNLLISSWSSPVTAPTGGFASISFSNYRQEITATPASAPFTPYTFNAT